MEDMIPEGILTSERGVKEETFKFGKYTVKAKIKVMTNREIDELNDEFTDVVGDSIEMDAPGLVEARLMRGILELNTTHKGKKWSEMDEGERNAFLDVMDPEIKTRLTKMIMAQAHLTKEERGFLQKRR